MPFVHRDGATVPAQAVTPMPMASMSFGMPAVVRFGTTRPPFASIGASLLEPATSIAFPGQFCTFKKPCAQLTGVGWVARPGGRYWGDAAIHSVDAKHAAAHGRQQQRPHHASAACVPSACWG
jgi:hypothetical protein